MLTSEKVGLTAVEPQEVVSGPWKPDVWMKRGNAEENSAHSERGSFINKTGSNPVPCRSVSEQDTKPLTAPQAKCQTMG